MNNKLNICRIIDQWGWAYYFIAREQAKYSRHNIFYKRIHDIMDEFDNIDMDILYLPCPDINKTIPSKLIERCREKNIKIIGGYAGEVFQKYDDSDLIITISSQTYNIAKTLYKDIPIIFLPESVDTDYFYTYPNNVELKVGWAGSYARPLKRTHLLNKLNHNVKIQCDRDFYYGKTADSMLNFYKSINCLVVTSSSECMPRVVLESMSCNLPVVATDVGALKFVLDDEWLVPVYPEDIVVKEMNYRLDLLNKYTSLRKEVGERNREYIERYLSWNKNQPLWDDVFSYLMYKDYDKIKNISLEYINSLPRGKLFNELISKKNILDASNIISILNQKNIYYWLEEESCLDCVRYKKLKIIPNVLKIGVREENEKNKIAKHLIEEYDFKFSSNQLTNGKLRIIININKNIKTKQMPIYEESINVPFPVIPYLKSKFGASWRQIQ